MKQQANFLIDRYPAQPQAPENRCASMEGVAAALAVLGQAGAEYAVQAGRMRSWLSNEADKLPKLQIQERQNRLLLAGDAVLTAPRLAAFRGGFLIGLYTPTVQIDAAAHCVAAMIMIERDGLLTRSTHSESLRSRRVRGPEEYGQTSGLAPYSSGTAPLPSYLRLAQRATMIATAPIASNASVSGSLAGRGPCPSIGAAPATAMIG